MKKVCFFVFVLALSCQLLAQNPISVIETTFKIKPNKVEEFYAGFAAGDQIVIEFSEVNGKEIKSFEVFENESAIRFSDYKVSSIEKKIISVKKKGVFAFKVTAPSSGRVCSLKISRVPKSAATADFNTNWKWATVFDTTYVRYKVDSLVGYDTIVLSEPTRKIVSEKLQEEVLVDNIVEVNSIGIINHDNPRTYLTVSLPKNRATATETSEVVSWAYWIGVGENSNSFWSKNKEMITQTVKGVVEMFSPLGALAAGAVSTLVIPDDSQTDNVVYEISSNAKDRDAFMKNKSRHRVCGSNGSGGYGKFTNERYLQGTYYICLYNDNRHDKIRVNVKASAVVKTTRYKEVHPGKKEYKPRYVSLEKLKVETTPKQMRVNVD